MKNNRFIIYFLYNSLIAVCIVIIYIKIYNILNIDHKSIFFREESLFMYDEIVYINFSKVTNIKEINELRKKSKYRKIGYGGHPISYTFSYPLDNSIILYPSYSGHFYELIVFIHCRPEEFYERFVYRKCYNKYNDIKIIYITSKSKSKDINKKLRYEANIYDDILQFSEFSSYFNLSIQTVHMISWSANLKYKFLLKSDIDVYINIPFLKKWLKTLNISKKYCAFGKISVAYVLRNKKYSHYVPKEIINEDIYPPYLQGVGYIMPYHTVKLLARTIEYVNPKIWIEDVFIGYALKYNNISLIDLSIFILRDTPLNISNVLINVNNYMLIHEFYPYEIYIFARNNS